MLSALLKPILGTVLEPLTKLIPDVNARKQAEEQITTKILSSIDSINAGIQETNKAEAQHSSMFVAGWRPFIGWVCGLGLLYEVMIRHWMNWAITVGCVSMGNVLLPEYLLPAIDTTVVYNLLLGMLGLGAMRTYEKFKGVAREESPTTKPKKK